MRERPSSSLGWGTKLENVMWTLVFLVFIGDQLESTVKGSYTTMYECFDEREALSIEVGGADGFFPPDSQAICVYRDINGV